MPRKNDLSKAFGERFKTEEKVDVQDPIAVAIQASQQTEKHEGIPVSPNESQSARQQESLNEDKNARMHTRTNVNEQESTSEERLENTPVDTSESKQSRKSATSPTRKSERIEVSEEAYTRKGVIIEVLYDQIQHKRHLSNGSFRYRADELEKLDAIFKELEEKKPGRISKNDIARMALITFYEDYEKNGDESVLAQVFKCM